MSAPRDPFSEVVDENRRWKPEWYSWLRENTTGSGSGLGGGGGIPFTATPTGTGDATVASFPGLTVVDGTLISYRSVGANTISNPTLDAGNGIHTITGQDPAGLKAHDIAAAGVNLILQWNAGSSTWKLLYPGFAPVEQGGGINQIGNKIYIGWSAATRLRATVDTTDIGAIVTDNSTWSGNLVSNAILAPMPPNTFKANTTGLTSNAQDVSSTNLITNAMRAQMPARTFKGNISGSTANVSDLALTGLPMGPANIVLNGADPTGVTDCTDIIKNVISAFGVAYVPRGIFKIGGGTGLPITFPRPAFVPTSLSRVGVIGEGSANTIINSTDTTHDVFRSFDSSPGNYCPTLIGLTITRTSQATTGYGVNFGATDATTTYDHTDLQDLYLSNHSIGMHLGGANPGWGRVVRVHCESNRLDGFELHGTTNILDCYASLNGRDGFRIDASNSQSCGQWRGLQSFSNTGTGFHVIGTSGAINAIRLSDCFFGTDGAFEVLVDSFGTGGPAHVFNNVYCESPGTDIPCFSFTANNPDVILNNCCGSASGTTAGVSPTFGPGRAS